MNRYPEVKKFVKTEGEADAYEGLEIEYIPGHNPDFVCLDAEGTVVERVDITKYNLGELHELVQERGFEVPVQDDEDDANTGQTDRSEL